jgi:hypothetical protein
MLDREQLLQIVRRVVSLAGPGEPGRAAPLEANLLLHGSDGWRHELLDRFDANALRGLARGSEDAYIWVMGTRDVPLDQDGLAVIAETRAGGCVCATIGSDGWHDQPGHQGPLGALRGQLGAIIFPAATCQNPPSNPERRTHGSSR